MEIFMVVPVKSNSNPANNITQLQRDYNLIIYVIYMQSGG